MPTNILANDLVQCKAVNFWNNQLGVNLWHFVVTAITNTPTFEGLMTEAIFSGQMAAAYKALMNNAASHRGITWKRLNPSPTVEFINSTQVGAGTGGANPLPGVISGLISLRTATPNRIGRGRRYVPFPAVTGLDTDATPTAAYVSNLTTLASRGTATQTIITSGANSMTVKGVLMSRKTLFTTRDLTTIISEKLWGNQHRRGSFGRQNVQPF